MDDPFQWRLPLGGCSIPSFLCLRRLLTALTPEAFQKRFHEWIASGVQSDDDGQRRPVAINGKRSRRSQDGSRELGPLQIVSAWAGEHGIALGQVLTDAAAQTA